MKSRIAIAVLAALAVAPMAQAQTGLPLPAQTNALSQNVSDLWWDPTQSGWGVALFQSGTFIYAVVFVYDDSGRPTWFAGHLDAQGNGSYTGPVYSTTGPWFGSPVYVPGLVTRTQVGTMTLTLQGNGAATLTYNVGSQSVTRTVVRQSLTASDLTGTFKVQSTLTASGCSAAGNNGTTAGTSNFTVTSTGGNNLQIAWQSPSGGTCSFNGSPTQSGRFASLSNSNYTCSSGETGTMSFSNLSSVNGVFSGQVSGNTNSNGCTYSGGFGGLNSLSTFSNQQQ
jgi:hypothetical protein